MSLPVNFEYSRYILVARGFLNPLPGTKKRTGLTIRQRAELKCTVGKALCWFVLPCLPLLVCAAIAAIIALALAIPAFAVAYVAFSVFDRGEREWNEGGFAPKHEAR